MKRVKTLERGLIKLVVLTKEQATMMARKNEMTQLCGDKN